MVVLTNVLCSLTTPWVMHCLNIDPERRNTVTDPDAHLRLLENVCGDHDEGDGKYENRDLTVRNRHRVHVSSGGSSVGVQKNIRERSLVSGGGATAFVDSAGNIKGEGAVAGS